PRPRARALFCPAPANGTLGHAGYSIRDTAAIPRPGLAKIEVSLVEIRHILCLSPGVSHAGGAPARRPRDGILRQPTFRLGGGRLFRPALSLCRVGAAPARWPL